MDYEAAARPELIRAMNEQNLLGHIRRAGPCSRAELARMTGLSKPTVSVALNKIQHAGLVRPVGTRTGAIGRAAVLYEIRGDAGFVLGLDASHSRLRGALADLSGSVRAELSDRGRARPEDQGKAIVRFAEALCAQRGLSLRDIAQTVIGRPAALGSGEQVALTPEEQTARHSGNLSSPEESNIRRELCAAFGASLRLESDVGAAALAESMTGHGRGVASLAYLSVGADIRIALVLGGRLHRGRHGSTGYASLPSVLDGSCQSSAVAARQVAQALCAVVAVVDPHVIVLGGPVGRAAGFAELVGAQLRGLPQAQARVRVSDLGADAVEAGCVSAGIEAAWLRLMSRIPSGEPRQAQQLALPTA